MKKQVFPQYDVFDAIHSMFPGGSITGGQKLKRWKL